MLPDRHREVFVAVALNEVPIDLLALKLAASCNGVDKNPFDAGHRLQARMAAAGHPVRACSFRQIPASGDVRPRRSAGRMSR